MTYAGPVFLWKPILRRMEALEGWCMAVQIRCSSSQPTNQPTNLSLKSFIATSAEPQESSDLAQQQAFVAPMMGYLRGMSSVNLAV